MWRTSFFMLTILATAISGMLFWQWTAYSKNNTSGQPLETENVQQRITVESISSGLRVSQTIEGLTVKNEYKITAPKDASEWNCLDSKGNTCKSKDKNSNSFQPENGKLRIVYTIPLQNNQSTILLDDWTAKLENVSSILTRVEIIDSAKREGTWVAGAPLVGSKRLDLIHYVVFEKTGEAFPIYYENTSLQSSKVSQTMTVYSHNNVNTIDYQFPVLKKLVQSPYTTIIYTNRTRELIRDGFIIVGENVSKENLERKVIYQYYFGKFANLQAGEQWAIDLVASATQNVQPQSKRANEVLNELKRQLTPDEFKEFFDTITKKNIKWNYDKLDQLLSSVKGKKTHFFVLNRNESMTLIPMYFIDSRRVRIDGKINKHIEIVYEDGKKLYPIDETLKGLGYDVKFLDNDHMLLLNKKGSSYRFYLNRSIFMFNEDNFGLLENPLTVMNGKLYMEDKWLQYLFKVLISESDQEIQVTSSPAK